MEKLQRVQNLKSNETSPNILSLPDRMSAEILSSIIDRARSAMGWNRLLQSSEPGENSEQDVAIITWYEILSDAGVPRERWADCYRSAQQRRNEQLAQGKKAEGMLTPNDLVVEWLKIKELHSELDGARLLPEHAKGTCQKCFGTGMERMSDGSVRPGCLHEPGDEPKQDRGVAFNQAAYMRAALKKIGNPKPVETAPVKEKHGAILRCSSCAREATTAEGWKAGDTCGAPLKTNETCPKCNEKTGVLSKGQMVCRDCFHIYDCQSCAGILVVN
jgi:hypothetical protein